MITLSGSLWVQDVALASPVGYLEYDDKFIIPRTMLVMDRRTFTIKSLQDAILFAILMGFLAFVLAGCTSVEDIAPAKEAVLHGMREVGFKFDSTLVSVSGEESKKSAVVTGPMIGPKVIPAFGSRKPVKAGDNYTRYKEVVLEMRDGNWIIVKAILREGE